MNIPPFEVGDKIEVKPEYRDIMTNVPRVVTQIRWVGKSQSQSGWLVDAETRNPKHRGAYNLTGYDSDWFQKI